MNKELQILQRELVPYEAAFKYQLELHQLRVQDLIPDTLVLLEHPHVYTLGRHARPENLLWDKDECRVRGIDLQETDRGGDISYHGPGQLVGYNIIKLSARGLLPRRLVEWVENTIIQTLKDYKIKAHVHPDYPGVWVGDAKICALGMRIREDVSYHGFALNVSSDLTYYSGIVACGIAGASVCSMASILGYEPDMKKIRQKIAHHAKALLDKETK